MKNFTKISIVIPVYNEKSTLKELIKAVEEAPLPEGMEREIVMTDDYSTDGTRDVLKGMGEKYKILYHDKNMGKGAALRTCFKHISGDIIIVQDADLEYDPKEYMSLIKPILDDKADVVYGSRFLGGRPHRVLFYWHSVGNRMLTWLSNMFTNLNLTDMETCYKVFTREVLDQVSTTLKSNRFGFEPEVTAKIAKLRIRIYEIGISYYGRTYDEGKKIGFKDAMAAFWHIIRFNLFK